jgi:hypothetical protein
MKVWVIEAHCGDHYCESEHVVAIVSDFDQIPALVAAAEEERISYKNNPRHTPKRWETVYAPDFDEAIEIGKLR